MTLKRPRRVYAEDKKAIFISVSWLCSLPQTDPRLHGDSIKQLNNKRTLGRNRSTKFINRHPEIENKRERRREAYRFNTFTPRAVHWYFDIGDKEYGRIKPGNTMNIDEGGIMSAFGLDSLVVGSTDPKRKAFLKGPPSRN
ncbi:DDE superfamily endonuclease [Hirsutella rhossiliensis]